MESRVVSMRRARIASANDQLALHRLPASDEHVRTPLWVNVIFILGLCLSLGLAFLQRELFWVYFAIVLTPWFTCIVLLECQSQLWRRYQIYLILMLVLPLVAVLASIGLMALLPE